MKKLIQIKALLLIPLGVLVFIFTSCEKTFLNDGDVTNGINPQEKYLYVIDNSSKELLMLDNNLVEISRWDLTPIVANNDVRGVTCNDEFLWISVTGSMDQIIKLASTGNSLYELNTMDAPPNKKGTIRELTWDGNSLWALNSGSVTNTFPAQIFKIDTETNTVLDTYEINTPSARGITYVGVNDDVYGRGMPKGLYVTDVVTDKVYVLDESTNFYEYFDAPLHPRGISYTSPSSISFSNNSFYLINTSLSSGNYLYRLAYKSGSASKAEVKDMLKFPSGSITAIQWSNFDFRQGVDPEIVSVVPNTGQLGKTLTVNIIGKGFTPDLTVSFGDEITVNGITFENSSSILANITIPANATTGSLNVSLIKTNGNTSIGSLMFNITDRSPGDGFIYYCDNFNGSINKIRISDLSLVDQWNPDYLDAASIQGLEFDDASLWISSGGSSDMVFKLDPATMTVVSSFSAPPNQTGTVRELAFDEDGNMWVLNSTENAIYNINKTDGTVKNLIATPELDGGARGIVFAENILYCVDYKTDILYTYDFNTDIWSTAFAIPVPSTVPSNRIYSTGITYDGVNFWISNSSYEHDYIFQVSSTGTLLQTITVLNAGDAKITGVAFAY